MNSKGKKKMDYIFKSIYSLLYANTKLSNSINTMIISYLSSSVYVSELLLFSEIFIGLEVIKLKVNFLINYHFEWLKPDLAKVSELTNKIKRQESHIFIPDYHGYVT
jgi:hypothetical protein